MISALRTIRLLTAACLLCAATPVAAADQEPDGPAESPIQQLIDESVSWFELTAGPEGQPLTPMPVLRWDNNSRGSASGLTVLYVAAGRPEAVCAIYPWEDRLVHEFDSLSRGAVQGTEEGVVFWRTEEPGVSFRVIPDADRPHTRRPIRLRQMKQQAERFGATLMGWRADDSDRQALRMLPRTIYRYETSGGGIVDGAVFAFVMGVDPEALLLIEAVETEDGPRWEYAFVRRTSGELQGSLDGQTVWTAERFPPTRDPASPHRSVNRPLELPDHSDGRAEEVQ